MIGNFSAIGNRGTGAMADYVNENILSKTKFLKIDAKKSSGNNRSFLKLMSSEARTNRFQANVAHFTKGHCAMLERIVCGYGRTRW